MGDEGLVGDNSLLVARPGIRIQVPYGDSELRVSYILTGMYLTPNCGHNNIILKDNSSLGQFMMNTGPQQVILLICLGLRYCLFYDDASNISWRIICERRKLF